MSLARAFPILLPLALLGVPGARPLRAEPPPAPPVAEKWVGLRVADPDLRYRAVGDTKGTLMEVADAIPYLLIALEDESPPVRAAARERLNALAEECVDPLLDAIQLARPGPKNTFAMLVGQGNRLTAADLATGAGALSPVQPGDRREAALVAALPTYAPNPWSEGPYRLACLRIASILMGDPDASVRRTAAGTLGLLGLPQPEHPPKTLMEADSADTRARLRLNPSRRERLADLLRGSSEIAIAAAGLAARFGDNVEPIGPVLEGLLEKDATRDAAALALAEMHPGSNTIAALRRHRSYGCWRARLRLGDRQEILAALDSTEASERRLALQAVLAEHLAEPAAVRALLPALARGIEEGTYAKVEPRLREVVGLGGAAKDVLPLLNAFAAGTEGDPQARDLAASAALWIDPTAPWARKRFEGVLTTPFPTDPASALAAATAMAALFEVRAVPEDEAPSPLRVGGAALRVTTLEGRSLGQAAVQLFHPVSTRQWPYARWLALGLDLPPAERAQAWKALRLGDLAAEGQGAHLTYALLADVLDRLGERPSRDPEVRAFAAHVAEAPDPWLRHLAARTLRRLGGS